MKQKAIVVGATGLVGTQLIRKLLLDDRFERVTIFARRQSGLKHPKLKEQIVDFDKISEWADEIKGDILFSAMGTTLKNAGSKETQYKIDYTYQFEVAKAAARNGVSKYVLISSAGANSKSKIFYSRIKGELDEAVQKLNFQKTIILRPSILDGDRKEKRTAEQISLKISRWITHFVFRKYRPIRDEVVANAMINSVFDDPKTGYYIYELDNIVGLTS